MFVDADWFFVFSWDQKLTFQTHKKLRKWARSSKAEKALPNVNRSNRRCLSIEKMPNKQRRGKFNNVLPPPRLIAQSFLTTGIVARSKHSSSKKLFLHDKLPKRPKGASKLTSFRAILTVRTHDAGRAECLLAPSSARFFFKRRRSCKRSLDRCSATHCQ